MRRLLVIALSLTILLPLVAVLLAFAAVSSQAQCAGGSAGPHSAPGVPASLLAIFDQAAASYQLGQDGTGGRTSRRSTRSRATSTSPRSRACTPAPTPTAPPGRCRSGSGAPLRQHMGEISGRHARRRDPAKRVRRTDQSPAGADGITASGAPDRDTQAAPAARSLLSTAADDPHVRYGDESLWPC
jgi:hypothetical protein